ncbi:putative bifunctional diguanylate cyclase/phosphodiesterase [Dyella sp.]|uniref:putative bifunctional diguanylate cyclase/phosphodiesterase n=1 Tax=Dyella sp. TaxID=1869338 RepID=UPI002D78378E|nr:EAL domain-containing protein [Dyella sp.]HET6432500.1 EAL domain-containing protein [Dyella sp.]
MPLAYALASAVVLIMAMTWGVLQVQVTLAGFLNSESIWSKAQKQAVIDLQHYAVDGDPAALASFRRNYGLLEADRWGRDAIASGHYEKSQLDEVFRRGNIMPAAQPGMIFMLRHFNGAPHLQASLDAWRSTDAPIAELQQVANELQRAYAAGTPPAAEIARQRARIHALNRFMQPRTELFSVEMVKGAVWAGQMLFWCVVGAFCLAAGLWMWMARRIVQSIRSSEERYRLLFDSASDAIVMVDQGTGRILDANRTAAAWTGRSERDLVGKSFSSLFADDPLAVDSTLPLPSARAGDVALTSLLDRGGQVRPVETRSSVARWGNTEVSQAIVRDVSERVTMERERRVAAKALGSIAEGVIIADAERRVVTVNAAHVEITGFTVQALQGLRFDDIRTLPDDRPLPDSVWRSIELGGNWRGEVKSRRRDGSSYPELLSISAIRADSGQVLHYVAVFTNITTTKADQRRLEHLATHDPLTGLANRAEFERRCNEALEHASRARRCVAVLFIDLDAFKIVNDSYSHAIGDRLLARIAERIGAELGEGDVAGRIGGDEFTVLATGIETRDNAADLASRLLVALAAPITVDDYDLVLSASIGIASYPLDGENPAALISNADAAMYAAKSEERNAFRFYSPIMQADARKRLQMASELRQALVNDEFRLVFQPSLELRTGRIVAVEALLRWQHPKRGLVMPDNFIPMAEGLGLIRRIDEWVLRSACAWIKQWDSERVAPIRVAVNVSASWFGHPAFIEGLHAALREFQVDPKRLLLEITESAILRLGEGTHRTMYALHAMGVGVAIDDFGTGYSSLAYLKLPAVVCLKIDRTFITGIPRNPDDVAIVEAILAMTRSLKLYAIAEGIEEEAQNEFLLRAGCEEGQGYLYARPLEVPDLLRMLKSGGSNPPTRLRLVPPRAG